MHLQFLETAFHAAHTAGDFLLQHFGKIDRSDIRTKSDNDFLTFVDEQSEKLIIDIIRAEYPGHAILAEESGKQELNSEFLWIIDPLDGTKNFISGLPVFAVSIALQVRGRVEVGVVYDPNRRDMFHAIYKNGSWLNHQPIRVSPSATLKGAFLATGFPFKYLQVLPQYMRTFEEVFRRSSGMRRMGAASLDLAYVAAGHYEGYWELGLSPWDSAAGSLLVTEAGGKITDFWGGTGYLTNSYTVATNGKIHQPLLDLIQKQFPEFIEIMKRGEK